jgi:hypothetical protein
MLLSSALRLSKRNYDETKSLKFMVGTKPYGGDCTQAIECAPHSAQFKTR